jgi:hypothetical protein
VSKIEEYCFACTEPIFVGEKLFWVVPRGGEWEEPHHEECTPTDFLVEENDVFPFNEQVNK